MWDYLFSISVLIICTSSKTAAPDRTIKHISLNPILEQDTPIIEDGNISYFLYNSKVDKYQLKIDEYGDKFIQKASIKLLLHGWAEDLGTFWYASTMTEYVKKAFNVILVDWSSQAQSDFKVAVSKIPIVAEKLSVFITGLAKKFNFSMERFHLIGHCLGAHIAGITAKKVYSQTRDKIGRITGLDPTGLTYNTAKENDRLAPDDAIHVDTIFTDSGAHGLALNHAVGYVNFYPNGGVGPQPGCLRFPCSHNRAAVYYQESITSRNFIAHKCQNYMQYVKGECAYHHTNVLGDSAILHLTGDFYLNTSAQSPFALGDI